MLKKIGRLAYLRDGQNDCYLTLRADRAGLFLILRRLEHMPRTQTGLQQGLLAEVFRYLPVLLPSCDTRVDKPTVEQTLRPIGTEVDDHFGDNFPNQRLVIRLHGRDFRADGRNHEIDVVSVDLIA